MTRQSRGKYRARGVLFAAAVCLMGVAGVQKAEAAEPVTFSQGSGAYDSAFELTLSAGNDTVYYTLDGSDPRTSDTRMTYGGAVTVKDRTSDKNVLTAIDPAVYDANNVWFDESAKTFASWLSWQNLKNEDIDKATVIRAVSKDSEGNYSDVKTETYFVGSMTGHIKGIEESCKAAGKKLAIMSITVNEEDFFDAKTGIYARGEIYDNALAEHLKENGSWNHWDDANVSRGLDANYKQKGKEWERACHIDYFESDGQTTSVELQQDCGVRIQGNYSRSDLQKGLRLYARSDYGKKNFNYAFFGEDAKDEKGKVIDKHKRLTLRNGGNCAFTSKFNDAFWQSLITDTACDTQANRPCVVYLNGEYWGLYILQEDYNGDYFEETYGVNGDDVVVYKGDAEAYESSYKLDEGNLPEGVTDEDYYLKELFDFFEKHTDVKSQEDFDELAKLVDVNSFRDYFAVNVWVNNKWDWPGKNWSMWKTAKVDAENPYADGRWRLCFYDMDFGGVSGSGDASANTVKDDGHDNKTGSSSLLDTKTRYPSMKVFTYLMTNEKFCREFEQTLFDYSAGRFEKTKAISVCDTFRDTYRPLLDQFFVRYYGVSNTNDAINGGYATYKCIVDFLNKREKYISRITKWIDNYYDLTLFTPEGGTGDGNNTDPDNSGDNGNTTDPGNNGDNGNNTDPGNSNQTTVKKDIKTLKITAKKSGKTITVNTLKKAQVTVTVNRSIIKSGKKTVKKITCSSSKNKTGKVKVSLSKKLKKGDKITVKVTKTGYKSKTKTYKVK